MTISQRAPVHGVECDVVCTGRFYDFLEKRERRWGIVLRQPIYEKDRLDPVDPAATVALDRDAARPVPGRATATSPTCRRRSATTSSATCRAWSARAVERLYRRGAEWLAGGEIGDPLKTVD